MRFQILILILCGFNFLVLCGDSSLFDESKDSYKNGEYEVALNYINDYLSSSDGDFEAWNLKGIILFKQKKYVDSIECFGTSLYIEKDNLNALLQRKCTPCLRPF